MIEKLLAAPPPKEALWAAYKPPPPAAAWVSAIVAFGNALPAIVTLTDMSIKGNPLVYVNPLFCEATRYGQQVVLGRNCRFLQGPATEPQSVVIMQDTLRTGGECVVKVTNYKQARHRALRRARVATSHGNAAFLSQGGEMFEMLLGLRVFRDAKGALRYAIGVQYEVCSARIASRHTRDLALLQPRLASASGDIAVDAQGGRA